MPLTNAERQRRFRERQQSNKAQSGFALTDEQIWDRDAVASEPIWPVPRGSMQVPHFLGWSRYDWSVAPRALVELVGLLNAWEGWQAEHARMNERMRQNHVDFMARVDAIIAEVGDRGRELMDSKGGYTLIREYEAGAFTKKGRKRVT